MKHLLYSSELRDQEQTLEEMHQEQLGLQKSMKNSKQGQ